MNVLTDILRQAFQTLIRTVGTFLIPKKERFHFKPRQRKRGNEGLPFTCSLVA